MISGERQPLVSFIIPYYNAGNTIAETVESIVNQSYENYNIWIINDGSTDSYSIEKLKQFEGHSKINILHQENAGPSIARNNAIRRTEATYIVPLDADDKILPNILGNAIHILERANTIGVVYGNLNFFGERREIKEQQIFDIKKQLIWNQVAVCAVIRKAVFETAGYYDQYLSKPGLEDWEFWIRVYEAGWKFQKSDEIYFEVRVDEQSRTFQVANRNLEVIKDYVYKKHSNLLVREYNSLFYETKMLKETPDYKIGNILLKPYRFLKSLIQSR
jgi:glycosyltransferase involved in cell wall biosynthesis